MSEPAVPARVRIAPSPTGFMHVGTARTAVFDWLLARSTGGQFILRVEDTDRKRMVEGAVEDLLDGLRWLGIEPDEGPGIGGETGPYVQSERLDIYRKHIDQLLASGAAYHCYCSAEDLAEMREARKKAGLSGSYDRRCRHLSDAEIASHEAAGDPYVVRIAMPLEGEVEVDDLLRGPIRFEAGELEDAVLLKRDGFPTYQFAVVVDDKLMGISHVLRGQEWISSSPIQAQLYRAFGWEQPTWVHVPLVLRPDGKGKLSKRDGDATLGDLRAAGYLPEAIFNFLAIVGWRFSGEQELFDRAEAIEQFDVSDLQVSGARWDRDKLNWMNGVYIRELEPADLATRLLPFLRDAGLPAELEQVERMVPLIQERLVTLVEGVEKLSLFYAKTVSPDPADMIPKKLDAAQTLAYLEATSEALNGISEADWLEANLEDRLRALTEELGAKLGPLLQPLRVAVTGSRVAPPMFGTLEIIGRRTCLARIEAGLALLREHAAVSP